MELYTSVSYRMSQLLTLRYSTSFSKSSQLFSASIRPHIFAIYGLVRIADEVVDTYRGKKTSQLLDSLEQETYQALRLGYSTNPIIHAFAQTAQTYHITPQLIAPFFASMRMDITKKVFTADDYRQYIYGSAEVIGLMCLKVFVAGDERRYASLKPGAQQLGSAYQKVNFLRDMASDYKERGRVYFPGVTYGSFCERDKRALIDDMKDEFAKAHLAIKQLPVEARRAVQTSYWYYAALLRQLERTPVSVIKTTRIRVNDFKKFIVAVKGSLGVSR